jgi:ABC-type amino acid transport substrate-binding protein
MTITVDAETYEEKKKEAFETINRTISSQQTQLEALAKDTKLGTELDSVESISEKYDEIKQKKEDGIVLNEDELEFYDKLTPKMETINSLEKTRNGMITAALV